MEDLRYEVDGPVARLTIDRPERRNAMSFGVMQGLREGVAAAKADDQPKPTDTAKANDDEPKSTESAKANDDDEASDEPKGRKKNAGKVLARIMDELGDGDGPVKIKRNGKKCSVRVPYVDMVVAVPCDKD